MIMLLLRVFIEYLNLIRSHLETHANIHISRLRLRHPFSQDYNLVSYLVNFVLILYVSDRTYSLKSVPNERFL